METPCLSSCAKSHEDFIKLENDTNRTKVCANTLLKIHKKGKALDLPLFFTLEEK